MEAAKAIAANVKLESQPAMDNEWILERAPGETCEEYLAAVEQWKRLFQRGKVRPPHATTSGTKVPCRDS
jgi:hypothetical protein